MEFLLWPAAAILAIAAIAEIVMAITGPRLGRDIAIIVAVIALIIVILALIFNGGGDNGTHNNGTPTADCAVNGTPLGKLTEEQCTTAKQLAAAAGTANNTDSDGDGVKDTADDCPNLKGDPSNQGCPVSSGNVTNDTGNSGNGTSGEANPPVNNGGNGRYPLTGQAYASNHGDSAAPRNDPYYSRWENTGRLWQPRLPNPRGGFEVTFDILPGTYVYNGVACVFELDEERTGSYVVVGDHENGLEFSVSSADGKSVKGHVNCDDAANSGFEIVKTE